jgi:hypothetical protein
MQMKAPRQAMCAGYWKLRRRLAGRIRIRSVKRRSDETLRQTLWRRCGYRVRCGVVECADAFKGREAVSCRARKRLGGSVCGQQKALEEMLQRQLATLGDGEVDVRR